MSAASNDNTKEASLVSGFLSPFICMQKAKSLEAVSVNAALNDTVAVVLVAMHRIVTDHNLVGRAAGTSRWLDELEQHLDCTSAFTSSCEQQHKHET